MARNCCNFNPASCLASVRSTRRERVSPEPLAASSSARRTSSPRLTVTRRLAISALCQALRAHSAFYDSRPLGDLALFFRDRRKTSRARCTTADAPGDPIGTPDPHRPRRDLVDIVSALPWRGRHGEKRRYEVGGNATARHVRHGTCRSRATRRRAPVANKGHWRHGPPRRVAQSVAALTCRAHDGSDPILRPRIRLVQIGQEHRRETARQRGCVTGRGNRRPRRAPGR